MAKTTLIITFDRDMDEVDNICNDLGEVADFFGDIGRIAECEGDNFSVTIK